MKRSRRGIRAVVRAPLVAGTLVLAACGGGESGAPAVTADGSGSTSPTPTIGAAPATGAGGTTRQAGARATGRFIDAQGAEVGEVTLEEGGDGVLILGRISGLTPGPHGLHFHEVGRCETPFESAGGHFNPAGRQHGLVSAGGPHAGDLTNLVADADGNAQIEAFAPLVTLGTGADGLLGGDGTALVVHAGADDHRTDPSGDSGDRVACAVLQR